MAKQAKKSIRGQQPQAQPQPDQIEPDENANPETETETEPDTPDDAADEGTPDEGDDNVTATSAGTTPMLEDTNEDDEPSDWASVPGAPKDDGLILGPNEPLRVDAEEYDTATVRLLRPVYRAFRPMGSKRWGFVLEYPKWHMMPKTMLVPAQQQQSQPQEDPESNPEGGDEK